MKAVCRLSQSYRRIDGKFLYSAAGFCREAWRLTEEKETLCQNKTVSGMLKAAVHVHSSNDSKKSCVFLQPQMLHTSCPPHHITFRHLLISEWCRNCLREITFPSFCTSSSSHCGLQDCLYFKAYLAVKNEKIFFLNKLMLHQDNLLWSFVHA